MYMYIQLYVTVYNIMLKCIYFHDRLPKIWKPFISKRAVYSEILDKWFEIPMTMRVLDLIDECHGFDNYILKVSITISWKVCLNKIVLLFSCVQYTALFQKTNIFMFVCVNFSNWNDILIFILFLNKQIFFYHLLWCSVYMTSHSIQMIIFPIFPADIIYFVMFRITLYYILISYFFSLDTWTWFKLLTCNETSKRDVISSSQQNMLPRWQR